MKRHTLVVQTLYLSGSHCIVRVIGLVMRIWLSRELGAAAMGLVELAHSAQMLLITPVVSGLPAAVSRMCAARTGDPDAQARVMRSGALLSLLAGVPLMLCAFLFREPLCAWLGDLRTMPALLVYLPCIPVLGISCALNGYFYGTGRPAPPALGEIIEQTIRFLLSVRLVTLLKRWPDTLRAAVPAAATLAGEAVSLAFMLALCVPAFFAPRRKGAYRALLPEMLALALPLTGIRLVASLMRTVNAALIPARLQLSGLGKSQALAQLGMMNGMLMPMLTLPSFITGSLCMVAAPEIARRQAQRRPLRPLCGKILLSSLAVGLLAACGVHLFAPFIANRVYAQPQLEKLLCACCPLIPIMSLCQVAGGIMNGLGLQSASLRIGLPANFVSVLLTWHLAASPALRLRGVLIAMGVSHLITLLLSLRALFSHIKPD